MRIEHDGYQSRRAFLQGMAGASGAVLLGYSLGPDYSWAQASNPQVARIVANTISVDMHNHVGTQFAKTPANAKPDPTIDLHGNFEKSGLSALCYTYAVDGYRSPQPGDWYQYHLQSLAYIDRLLAKNGMRRALTIADLKAAHSAKTPIVIQDCEGAQWIEGRLERVEEAYKRGLRHMQLLHQMHDLVSPLGGVQQLVEGTGGVQNNKSANITGLTSFGADVIRECNRLGIVVDMAHSNEETTFGPLKVARQPLVVSHTALNNALSKTSNTYVNNPGLADRLVSPKYVKAVAAAGGVVGIWRIFPTMKDYVTAIKQMADVAGVDHTGIGTDTSLASAASGDVAAADNAARGNAAAAADAAARGDRGGGAVGSTNNIWPDEKNGFLYSVVQEMLTQGFRPDEISKIAGGNYLRIFEKVTARRA